MLEVQALAGLDRFFFMLHRGFVVSGIEIVHIGQLSRLLHIELAETRKMTHNHLVDVQ